MGEVYKARDTRLERTVAIKILPLERAAAAGTRERFELEARTISQLSHPHICALYDVGRHGDIEYLVIEYLEGETLAARLARGPLPLDQALRFGVEIADALDVAHRRGVVHRDLKPGNVMLTLSGVKLLDFGLAKVIGPSEGAGGISTLATMANLTQEGVIVGTVQYMAPEQLDGKEADARSDIFSFGALLHEMATGRKAFSGATQASLISAILRDEPQPISQVQPMCPPALDRVVATCLAKNPDDRWQTARDLVRELRWVASNSGHRTPAPVAVARARKGRPIPMVAAFFAGALAAGLLLWPLLHRPPAPARNQAVWLSMALPAEAPFATYGSQRPVFSPDASRVAYVAVQAGIPRLYLRDLDALDVRPVRESDGADTPFFSPDSRWLGFSTGTKIVKVPVEGGVPQTIVEANEIRGASWGPDGTIVFATGTSGLRRVPAGGGASEQLPGTEGGFALYWPRILPGGEAVLFTSTAGTPHAVVLSLKTGQRHDLIEGTDPQYSPSGHLVFARGGTLFAAPFDLKSLSLTGPAISVLEGVMVLSPFAMAQFGLSAGGALVYAPGSAPRHTLVMVDRRGKAEPLSFGQRGWEEPRLSPDGKRIAVCLREGDPDLWILDLARGTVVRLTFEAGEDETPAWSPDGRQVTYKGGGGGGRAPGIYRRFADGTGAEERLLESEQHVHAGSWSPDGRILAYTVYHSATSGDIWVSTPGAKEERHPWLQTPFNERAARFSPDGRYLLYVSNESGRDEIYVQPFPGPGGKWQISIAGGTEPVWSRDGREIFYRTGDQMMAARVAPGSAFSVESPRVLFEGKFVPTRRGEAAYDVSADGQKFLMVQPDEHAVPTRLNVALDFSEELKRRVPSEPKP
jgi:serine/threonine-protein kinase